uniref:C2 domain-containing protein n=1 Tax=Davidia involucrata TaxID=16924 RepID=A0A5B7AAD9_DAVIN
MDSFNQTTGFQYNPNSNTEGDVEFSGILDIYVHHARNIHNICIYDNQDVYAKFSLTYNPDETLSTRIINGGGKNPEFNENLIMKITQFDAVLKCEIWMLSRAKNFMEDQLLGFALVPISSVVGKGKVTQDFSLSSTDLFHSPAGTVKLSLSLNTNVSLNPFVNSFLDSVANSSITSEVVLLDRKISEVVLDPVEYSRIEFPEISVVRENQQMVSEYFDLAGRGSASRPGLVVPGSFLHLGAPHQPVDDYEMAANSSEDNRGESLSPNGSIQTSGFLSSTMTSLSDDRNSADSMEKKNHLACDLSNSPNVSITTEANQGPSACPGTPTSKKGSEVRVEKEPNFSGKEEESNKEGNMGSVKFGQVFSAPLGNINIEAEQSAMQQQIVDMYMRSMQQFTESLAKMKLPMDLNKQETEDPGVVIQDHNKVELEKKKKDGSRVFYGSRAFF